jgi:hypothetical protein
MKKIILSTVFILAVGFSANAQSISKNAIGLRLGDNDGFGGEVSFQRKLAKTRRLELDLGWRNSTNVDAIKLAGLYQWVWNIEGNFNWYAGVGGGIGSWSYNKRYKDNPYYNFNDEDNGVYAFAAGDIGIEYHFDFPLLLSLDFRPEIYFNGYGQNFGPDVAISARYQF